MKNIFFYETSLGTITIAEENNFVTNIWITKLENFDDFNLKETKVIKETYTQITEYLDGKRKLFTVPLSPSGTEYFKKAWNELQKIPYGETRTYKDIASAIGNPKAARAVGLANNRNPIPIIIPCHRVIGSNNKLVGFAYGLDMKANLIDLEKNNK